MAARKEPKADAPPTEPTTEAKSAPSSAATQSELVVLQELLDEERIAHAATRAQLESAVPVLQARIAELEGELAKSAARLRELDAQLQARRR